MRHSGFEQVGLHFAPRRTLFLEGPSFGPRIYGLLRSRPQRPLTKPRYFFGLQAAPQEPKSHFMSLFWGGLSIQVPCPALLGRSLHPGTMTRQAFWYCRGGMGRWLKSLGETAKHADTPSLVSWGSIAVWKERVLRSPRPPARAQLAQAIEHTTNRAKVLCYLTKLEKAGLLGRVPAAQRPSFYGLPSTSRMRRRRSSANASASNSARRTRQPRADCVG